MNPRIIDSVKRFLPIVILFTAAVATYHGVLRCDFLTNWDDSDYVTLNPLIRGFTQENIKQIFFHPYLANYAPVHLLSYMLDYSLWGLNPLGFHLTNLLLHLVSGFLLYFLAIRMDVSRLVALGAAIIFLVHPVQVETVAWVSQRKNLLAMVFFLSALHCYTRFAVSRETSRQAWYLLSLGAFCLAILSKSVAVILPIVLLVYDHCFQGDAVERKRLLEKVPFFLLAAAGGLVAVLTQSPDVHGGRIAVDIQSHLQIMLTMLTVLKKYLLLIVWPARLNIVYAIPLKEGIDLDVISGVAILAVTVVVGWFLYRKNSRMFFWYSLFFIGLLPVSQIVPLITLMNDRYLYFPMAGLSLFVSAGAARLLHGKRFGNVPFLVLVCLLAAMLGALSHERVKTWRSTLVLWTDSVQKSPESASAWSGMGNALEMEGRDRDALDAYLRALALSPDDRAALVFASLLYQKMGMLTESQSLALRLVRRYPRNVDGWLTIGENFAKVGEMEKAEAAFRKVLEIEPGNSTAKEWLEWLNRPSSRTGDRPDTATPLRQGMRP